MEPGVKYLVIHQSPSQRFARASVLKFLGQDTGEIMSFDARPVAGTQNLPRSWVKSIWSVSLDAKISLNERAGTRLGMTRVL
jgi:hypothetical protein